MSYGEILSAHLLTDVLNDRKISCEYLDMRAIIVTDDNFGAANVDFEQTNHNIKSHFSAHKKLQIATGFIAATRNQETTTIGRGGSDYTASIIGAALSAKSIEIWTDVDGVMTTGQFLYSADGKTHKVFGPHDNEGIKLLKGLLPVRFITADKRGFGITKRRIVDDMGCPLDLVPEAEREAFIAGLGDRVAFMGDGYSDAR